MFLWAYAWNKLIDWLIDFLPLLCNIGTKIIDAPLYIIAAYCIVNLLCMMFNIDDTVRSRKSPY